MSVKALKLGTQTGSFFNHIYSTSNQEPSVETGATVLHWTDRTAYFVNSVSEDKKTVVIERAKAVRTDDNGMSDCQSYRYERNANAEPETVVFRYGQWYTRQEHKVSGKPFFSKINISFGFMREYRDYSF